MKHMMFIIMIDGENPFLLKQDILHIKTKEKLQSYEVITANGSLVKSGTFDGKDYRVNMQGLTKGVYFVKVEGNGFATADKVVKM